MPETIHLQKLIGHSFCIYGAGIVATGVYTVIKALYDRKPSYFLVSGPAQQGGSAEQAPAMIDGIAVRRLSDLEGELRAGTLEAALPEFYLIATRETTHAAIMESLLTSEVMQVESEQIIILTNEAENELMEAYYGKKAGAIQCVTARSLTESAVRSQRDGIMNISQRVESVDSEISGSSVRMVQVFQAKSHMDKPLTGESSDWPAYIRPIQVGAALTDRKIVNLQDDRGDNISSKNCNYCELTATYYAWKHSSAAYKGICHYRRIFAVNDEQMQMLLQRESDWDVILPYPSIHYPDISTQHTRYVTESDWKAMLQALEELEPAYLEAYEKSVLAGEHCFFNFNMLIAKATVFDDYCSFLFEVLERTEELAAPKGWERADRFAGYLGENLTTIYFLKNRERWKIAYAGKIWLV